MTITAPAIEKTTQKGIGARADHHALNAALNLFASDGSIQFEKDHEALRA